MICNKCGAQNSDEAKFCLNCGFPVNAPQEKTAPAEYTHAENQSASETPAAEQPIDQSVIQQPYPAQPVNNPYGNVVPPQPAAYPYANAASAQPPIYPSPFPAMPQEPKKKSFPGKGLSIAGMVLGIVSIAIIFACSCCLIGIFSAVPAITSIVGLILSIIGKVKSGKDNKNGFAVAGIICSAIALVLSIGLIVLVALSVLKPEMFTDLFNEWGIDASEFFDEFGFNMFIGL